VTLVAPDPTNYARAGIGRRVPRRTALAFALIASLFALGAAAAAPRAGSPRYSSPAWSPDSRTIAFVRMGATNRRGDEIFKVREDGTSLTRLTRNLASDEDPVWSPDGKKIVFASSRVGSGVIFLNENIYEMNRDGKAVKRLTTQLGTRAMDDRSPAWAPDGKQIAFVSSVRAGGFTTAKDLFLVTLKSRRVRRVTRTVTSEEVAYWSPEGKILVARFDGSYAYDVLSASGRRERRLKPPGLSLWPYADYSADGKSIAFVASPTPTVQHSNFIFVMSSTGAHVRKLTRGAGDYESLDWAPNGKKIVFEEGLRIYVIGADGRNKRRLPLP
jgi:Tol biopolymer transport system component